MSLPVYTGVVTLRLRDSYSPPDIRAQYSDFQIGAGGSVREFGDSPRNQKRIC